MKNKKIAARKFSHKYLTLIVILSLIFIGVLYTTYLLYFSVGTILVIAYIFSKEPRLAYYSYKLIKLTYRPLTSKYKTWNQGAKGEEIVAKYLDHLSEEYLVINDVMLPSERGNIDHIVIGENGLFIIETKTHKGIITCNGDAWAQEKIGKGGSIYRGRIGSPSKQVKRQTIMLRKFLTQKIPKLSNMWIQGIVVFANKESKIERMNSTVPVLKPEQLVEFIKNRRSSIKLSQKDIQNAKMIFETIM